MELEVAQWLADLIHDTIPQIELRPGLLIESVDNSAQWIQVILESNEVDPHTVSGVVLNFPYRGFESSPLDTLSAAGLKLPPGTTQLEWEDNGFVTMWLRPDIPLVALALLIGDILHHVCGMAEDQEISVEVNYGL